MAKDTKQRILNEALVMFAQRGYGGTNMRELAQTLGLGKSALYKHYESKEAIWNTLLEQIEERYSQQFGSAENLPKIPDSCEEFIAMSMGMVDFTIHDEQVSLARKLLLGEQFRDDFARDLATEHFLTRFDRMFSHVFAGMIEKGLLEQADPQLLALSYAAPISSLVMQIDREPATEAETVERIRQFATFFMDTYKAV